MEYESYFRFVLALVFVLGLIVLAAWVARRFGLGGALPTTRGRGGRLGVVETLALDAKHRLILVRRDNVEHLILLGTQTDAVIETQLQPPIPPPANNREAQP